ncbi:VPLPA-CTERM sorting domain-containing protein [Palleronia sp. LCG004]|uniref:VPLPA-CTERM sorting domain-containing protein n=1 Tax=Palleronia sp. LCG004 TaxID=3079304 RepID=UPI002942540D|nr:VPLPA-CTERM sorting domain-containing protein [Palleronia sp. LCG004]WOI55506.1 VPLPA-CTERM sorting domain-containing protein [Palleronia sp. LCG004]
MKRHLIALAATTAALAAPAIGHATTTSYVAVLKELNNSGVSGRVNFFVEDSVLRVEADIRGLVPSLPHVNHIHGRFNEDGTPRKSLFPGTEQDIADAGFAVDGDGLAEVFEAAPLYGDVLLSLENPEPRPGMGNFHQGPVADADGNLNYSYTFSLLDPDPTDATDDPFFSTVGGPDYQPSDIFPLDLREYVIHGAFVPGSTLNEGFSFVPGTERADGTGYSATLPVAAAQISAVPLPAGALLLLTGLGGLGYVRKRRKAA